jgi:hypothetical protein
MIINNLFLYTMLVKRDKTIQILIAKLQEYITKELRIFKIEKTLLELMHVECIANNLRRMCHGQM